MGSPTRRVVTTQNGWRRPARRLFSCPAPLRRLLGHPDYRSSPTSMSTNHPTSMREGVHRDPPHQMAFSASQRALVPHPCPRRCAWRPHRSTLLLRRSCSGRFPLTLPIPLICATLARRTTPPLVRVRRVRRCRAPRRRRRPSTCSPLSRRLTTQRPPLVAPASPGPASVAAWHGRVRCSTGRHTGRPCRCRRGPRRGTRRREAAKRWMVAAR